MKENQDALARFIAQNRAAFDRHEDPALWPSIEAALPARGRTVIWHSVTLWRAAAVVFFALSAVLLSLGRFGKSEKPDTAALLGFNDLENYYGGQISEKMDLVHRYQAQTDLTEDDVTQNLKKLEAMYLVLKDQLKARPTQDVRDALVLNLLVRIDLINQQLHKLDSDHPPVHVGKTKNVQS